MSNVSLVNGHIDRPKMTDEEIIKALECCADEDMGCEVCPYWAKGCTVEKDTIDLINRQQAEIERLKEENKFHRKTITENAQRALEVTIEEIEKAKSEAIKEFAERLKTIFNFGVRVYEGKCTVDGVVHNIDNLVKEMVGDEK